jgi:hypothetical protein
MGARLRRLWSGEYEEDTLRTVPAWGFSVLLHGFLLLVLALMLQFGRNARSEREIQPATLDTQLGDVQSIVDATRAGDPFTTTDSLDPPSLNTESADAPLTLVGQPEIRSIASYEPVIGSPTAISDAKGSSIAALRLPELNARISAPFSGRTGMSRAKLVLREGGTARSEQAVEDGIDWLARHQREDGSWSLNYAQQCQAGGCVSAEVMNSDTAATGLALLPMLGAGYTHTVKNKHQDTVRRGIEWLVEHEQPNGDLFVGPPGLGWFYSHAIGTMAICEAYGITQDPRLKKPAQRAIQFIIESQNPVNGGWRYHPGQDGDTSVFGWQMFALRSAHMAGLTVPKKVLKGASTYLNGAAADPDKVTYAYLTGRNATNVMTAEGLVCRQLLGWPREFPALVKGAALVAADLETSDERNIYYWYYATQLLHNMHNKDWENWNVKVRDGLVGMQVKDAGCAKGSWDPEFPLQDRWGRAAGRLFVTSLSILTLEVYYRYLPMYRGYDDDQPKSDGEPQPPAKTNVIAKKSPKR